MVIQRLREFAVWKGSHTLSSDTLRYRQPCGTLNVSVKKRLVQHHKAPVYLSILREPCTSWTRLFHEPDCTRRFHELVCIQIQPPSLSFLTPRSCVRYIVRLIVIAISWRHRALPVLARRRRPGQVVGFTSRASTPPSRCSQTAPWRRRCGCRGRSPVSTGGCRRQIPCRSLSSGSQSHSQKVRSFSSFPTKGDAESSSTRRGDWAVAGVESPKGTRRETRKATGRTSPHRRRT